MKLEYREDALFIISEDWRDYHYLTNMLGFEGKSSKGEVTVIAIEERHEGGIIELQVKKKERNLSKKSRKFLEEGEDFLDFEDEEEPERMTESEMKKHREVTDYLFHALFAKEACHKQWAIERSLEILGMKLEDTRKELEKRGFMGNKSWEPGVQPP